MKISEIWVTYLKRSFLFELVCAQQCLPSIIMSYIYINYIKILKVLSLYTLVNENYFK
jgi:hypothetical protein